MSPVRNAELKEPKMAAPPIPSALDARTQIFPTLIPSQIDRIRPQGRVRHVDRGEILFDLGDTNIPFFVILSGSMEVVQPGLDGERPITVHRAGGFTGELTMISGPRPRPHTQKAAGPRKLFRRSSTPRPLKLTTRGWGSLILLGPRHSAHTL